ncbi:MAG TPA: glycosyltransferase, partial [Candidatus Methanoperedens sp.]
MTLEWTGERFIPWMEGAQIHYEHFHRYAFASQLVSGKYVLDLACGEGYGSSLLSKKASHVIGIEIDGATIKHARRKYTTQDLEFIQGSVLEIPILTEKKFDVIVCFEVIEHLEEHEKLLSEVKRLLKKEGLFIISSPNKKVYSDDRNFINRFHKKELYFDEFRQLLDKNFENNIFFGQSVFVSSNIWPLDQYSSCKYMEFVIEKKAKEYFFSEIDKKNPEYFIAIASDSKLILEYNYLSNLIDISNILITDSEKKTEEFIRTKHDLQKTQDDLQKTKADLQETEANLLEKESKIQNLEATLQSIHNSMVWRILMKYDMIMVRILPGGTKRRNLYNQLLTGFRATVDNLGRVFVGLTKMRKLGKTYPSPEFEDLTQIRIEKIKEEIKNFSYNPKISIITPVWNPDEKWLRKAIESVAKQTYTNWELCLADGDSKPEIRKILKEYADKNDKIKVKFLSANNGISGNSNEALSMATGEFVGLMDHDDEISIDALYEVVKLLNESTNIDFIYSDEDKIELKGKRVDPLFKPDWSPDFLLFTNYLNHFTIIRKKLLEDIKGFRTDFDGSQDYDLYLRVTELTNRIAHIPKVLYHWRKAAGSAAAMPANKSYAHNNGKKAIIDALKRREVKATIEDAALYRYRVKYEIIGNPKVAIIIPTKNKGELLKKCIDSIENKTDYKNYEIIVVDNNSNDIETLEYLKSISTKHKVLKYTKQFNFSDLNNWAVSHTDAEHILFLNNDIEIIS